MHKQVFDFLRDVDDDNADKDNSYYYNYHEASSETYGIMYVKFG